MRMTPCHSTSKTSPGLLRRRFFPSWFASSVDETTSDVVAVAVASWVEAAVADVAMTLVAVVVVTAMKSSGGIGAVRLAVTASEAVAGRGERANNDDNNNNSRPKLCNTLLGLPSSDNNIVS